MLGRTHIVSAQVAWLAVAPIYLDTTWKIVVGIPIAGMAALGPDIDSGGSTICRLLFWFPDAVNRVAHFLFRVRRRRMGDRIADALGGHRNGAHSVLSVFTVFWLSALSVQFVDGWWLTMAVTLGWVVHIVGDCCTEHGVALLWPWTRHRYRVATMNTGGWVEGLLRWVLNVAALVLVVNLAGVDVTRLLPSQ